MLKREMTYEDFHGESRTEEFFFNLSKAELIELSYSMEGGLEDYLRRLIAAKDTKEIIEVFKIILFKAYGIKSPDGKRFMKSEEISRSFAETNAYSDLFMELALDATKAAQFINGIVPKDLNT